MKQIAKAGKPRIVLRRSLNVLGTSSDTTRRVSAKPKTASLKDSSLLTSRPRRRNPGNSRESIAPAPRSMWVLLAGPKQRDKLSHEISYHLASRGVLDFHNRGGAELIRRNSVI